MSFRINGETARLLARLQERYATADGTPMPAARVLRMALDSLEEYGPPSRKTSTKSLNVPLTQ